MCETIEQSTVSRTWVLAFARTTAVTMRAQPSYLTADSIQPLQ
jgi:hypothetical protein